MARTDRQSRRPARRTALSLRRRPRRAARASCGLTLAACCSSLIVGAFFAAPASPGGSSCRPTRRASSSSTSRRASSRARTSASSRRSRRSLRRKAGSGSCSSPTSPTRRSRREPAAELKPLLRFFAPADAARSTRPTQQLARSPWDQWFSGGTKISNGLFLALHMLDEQHAKQQRGHADQRPRRRSDRPGAPDRCGARVPGPQGPARDRRARPDAARTPTSSSACSATTRSSRRRRFRPARRRAGSCELNGTFSIGLAVFARRGDRAARPERVVGRAAALAKEARMIRRLVAAAVLLVAAVFFVLLARDAWHWSRAIRTPTHARRSRRSRRAPGRRTRRCPPAWRAACSGSTTTSRSARTAMRGTASRRAGGDAKNQKQRAVVETALARIARGPDPQRAARRGGLPRRPPLHRPAVARPGGEPVRGRRSAAPRPADAGAEGAWRSSSSPCGSTRTTTTPSATSS